MKRQLRTKSNKRRTKNSFKFSLLVVLCVFSAISSNLEIGTATESENYNQEKISVAILSKSKNTYYDTAFSLEPRFETFKFTNSNITEYSTSEISFNCTFIIDFDYCTEAVAQKIAENVQNGMGLFFQTQNPHNPYNVNVLNALEGVLPINISNQLDPRGSLPEVFHTEWDNIDTRETNAQTFLT